MAAFEMLDNKLCGDWQGLPKCPEMEAGLYEKYAHQFPDGPRTAEALYNAVYREATVVTMYTVQEDRKKADDAAAKTQSLAAEVKAKFPQTDFAARAVSIAFKVQTGDRHLWKRSRLTARSWSSVGLPPKMQKRWQS